MPVTSVLPAVLSQVYMLLIHKPLLSVTPVTIKFKLPVPVITVVLVQHNLTTVVRMSVTVAKVHRHIPTQVTAVTVVLNQRW